jgi:hypothetical protein
MTKPGGSSFTSKTAKPDKVNHNGDVKSYSVELQAACM